MNLSFKGNTVEAIGQLGEWFHATTCSAPPPRFIHVSHSHTHRHHYLVFSTVSSSKRTQPHLSMLGDTQFKKTSKVGANPESHPTLSIHQLFLFCSPSRSPPSYSNCRWEGLWESTASCIHLSNKRVFFCNLQCQMHSLSSPAYIYHQRNDPF